MDCRAVRTFRKRNVLTIYLIVRIQTETRQVYTCRHYQRHPITVTTVHSLSIGRWFDSDLGDDVPFAREGVSRGRDALYTGETTRSTAYPSVVGSIPTWGTTYLLLARVSLGAEAPCTRVRQRWERSDVPEDFQQNVFLRHTGYDPATHPAKLVVDVLARDTTPTSRTQRERTCAERVTETPEVRCVRSYSFLVPLSEFSRSRVIWSRPHVGMLRHAHPPFPGNADRSRLTPNPPSPKRTFPNPRSEMHALSATSSRVVSAASRQTRSLGRVTRASGQVGTKAPTSSSHKIPRRSVFLASGMTPLLRLATASTAVTYASSATAKPAQNAQSEISKVLLDPKYPDVFPFGEKEMQRYDEAADDAFYAQPRFVKHIDDDAIGALTKYYATVFPAVPKEGDEKIAFLDVCSSWISHYPSQYVASDKLKISGLGMNEDELKKNPILTDYAVRDLNIDATLPYEDNTFDVVTNAVSVDYLTKPLEMMKEVQRVLKPGGLAVMSFSNRCFPTKAVSVWTSTGDLDHIWIVGSYFHFAGGFAGLAATDISPKPGKTDPMYVVFARKEA